MAQKWTYMYMNKGYKQFYALLRSGLWNTSLDYSMFCFSNDWDTVMRYAFRQTVLGHVVDGCNALSLSLQPPKSIFCKIRESILSGIQAHALLNAVLVEVVMSLQEQGFNPVLLKGQGVALNYLEPTSRQCGDIDLYIGPREYERAREFISQHYVSDGSSSESFKHYHFTHSGVVIELHRVAECLPVPWQNSRFQRWTEFHLSGTNLRKVKINEVDVNLPPVDFDVLYIFNHAWHHFSAGGGIGLRQLCDWVMYLHTFHHVINLVDLERNLKSFGLWRIWLTFGFIAVDVLGLPKIEFPFYTERYKYMAYNILNMIEQEGNFGVFHPDRENRPKKYFAGKLHSFRWMNRRFMRLFPLNPGQFFAIWVNYLYVGFKEVIIRKFKFNKR